MTNRIFVGWDNGDFISMGISDNNDECKDFQLLVRENGPPDTVEYRAAGEGYVSGSDGMEAGDECPNCHCGTLEETDEEFVCRGECGAVWPLPPKGTCILTGAPGESEDDCTTHSHETSIDTPEAEPIPTEVLYGLGLQEFADAFNAYSQKKAGEK
tara:strand:+ start:2032 stop:2499 length:468 start_codon:yes stop_codon:yes gene_type:complete